MFENLGEVKQVGHKIKLFKYNGKRNFVIT